MVKNGPWTTEVLWEQFGDKVKRYLLKRVSDEQVAEDLLQEAFIRIHNKLDDLDDTQRIASWVFQIARNLVIDYYRSKSRRATEIADELEAEAEDEANINTLVSGWLPQMMALLPESYREAVELYELQRVPQQEIAKRLGISLSGAKSRVQRGREKLKSLLLECCTFEKDRLGNLIDYTRNKPGQYGDCTGPCD